MNAGKEEIRDLDRIYRLNLINSISGIKPANLIGTASPEGINNVAIFSSVVHLGSHPPQLGMIMRPQSPDIKDTYRNIKESGFYTINHVTADFYKKAHYTSAKLSREESEFDRMRLTPEIINGFAAPFVSESPVKMGMKLLEFMDLPNGCILAIGEVERLIVKDTALLENGQLDLSEYGNVGISGLNSYYELTTLDTLPYVRENETPELGEE
jgi:flavin reductase (DIM6/NTAB) family NADH-FMN oxidoreductase RutF